MPTRLATADLAQSFTTFGAFLRYLRRRVRLTQSELGIAVGYSTPQISLLKNGHRLPDLATVAALFVPALDIQHEPELAKQLLQLAAATQAKTGARNGQLARREPTSAVTTITPGTSGDSHSQPLSAPPHVPAPALPLIGRAYEIERIFLRLGDPAVRLLTLLRPPGVGKTRLALQVAWAAGALFADGACFIPLTAIVDPALVIVTILQALDISDAGSDPDQAIALLGDKLRTKHMLLVLDNFEHLLPIAPLVGRLLAAAPQVKILVTSRAALHVYGENEFPIPPLALPDLAQLPRPDDLINLATCLMGLACVAISIGTPPRLHEAALVWAAAHDLLHSAGGQLEAIDQRTFDPYLAVARAALGEGIFDAAW